MRMKKSLVLGLVIILALSFALTGCGQGGNENETKTPAETGANEGGETIKLKLAHVVAEDTPLHKGALEFKKLVEERTNGKVIIDVYPNGALGDNRAALESLQFGTIDFSISNISLLSGFSAKTGIFELPYIIKSNEAAKEIIDGGEITDLIFGDLEKSDLMYIGGFIQGWRNTTTTNREVRKPEDMKGLKIRTMDTAIHMDFFNSLGASAVPMPFSELFTGLQQGAVDAQENPYTNIYTQGYHEVQKYVIETKHIYDITPFMMSKVTYDKLPEEYRKIIVDTAMEIAPKQREASLAGEEEFKQKIADSGKVTIIELTPEEKQAFADAARKLYSKYEGKIGADIIKAVIDVQEGYSL